MGSKKYMSLGFGELPSTKLLKFSVLLMFFAKFLMHSIDIFDAKALISQKTSLHFLLHSLAWLQNN